MAVISHVFACLFYRLGVDTMRNGNPHTWLSAPNVNLAKLAADGTVQIYHSLNYRYLLAMYWSVQTLDTVGFGDIAPRSMPETFFCILFFYISGFLIYYSIANLMTIVMDADSARTSTLISKARFAKYAIYRNLPEVVCTRIENYYNYKYETLKGVDEKMIISQLPPNISQQIHQFVIRDLLSSIEVFNDLNKGMLNALSENVETYFFSPDDVIIGPNSVVSGAHVVSRGEIGLISPTGEVLNLLRAREHFGLMALNANYPTVHSYKSRSFSEVFFLRGSVYRHICHLYLKPVEIEDLNHRRLTLVSTDSVPASTSSQKASSPNSKPESNSSPLPHQFGASRLKTWSTASSFARKRTARTPRSRSRLPVLPAFIRNSMKPLSLPRRLWDCIIFGGMIFYSISLGLLLSASLRESFYHDMWGLLVASYVFDIIFAINALLHWKYFNFVRDGVVITHSKEISKHFWEENHPLVVFISILPVDLLVAAASSYKLLPTFRLLKLLHLRQFSPFFEHFTNFFSDKTRIPVSFELSRFITLYFLLYLLCHWAGCFWILSAHISVEVYHYPLNWIMQDKRLDLVRIDQTSMYAVNYSRAIYWAASVMSSIGFPDIMPMNPVEIVAIILVMFIGYLLFNTLLGAIANLMSSFNRDNREFNAKVKRMRGLMKHTKVPPEIEGRVLRYYEYVWSRFSGVNESEILEELPKSLRTEIVNHIMRPMVTKIPFFRNLSEPMEHMLMGLFEPRIALDGDALVLFGDIGKEMFVIERGTIIVCNEHRTITYATLGAGDYIGESCLLEMSPRTASAYAVGYVDTYFLTNDNFYLVAEKFPQEYITIVEAIKDVIAEKKQKNDAARAAKAAEEKAMAEAAPTAKAVELMPTSPVPPSKIAVKNGSMKLPNEMLTTPFNILNKILLLCSPKQHLMSENKEGFRYFHPDSQPRLIYDLVICFTLGYYAVMIPFRLALHITSDLYAVDYIFDFLNVVDAYLHAQRYALYRGGHMLTNPHDIWSVYVRERLWMDVMAFLPYDLLVLIFLGRVSSGYFYFIRALLRIPKIFKVSVFPWYYGQVERMVTYFKINYIAFKILELTLLILVIAHWVACGWYILAMKQHEKRCRDKPDTGGLLCKFIGTWVEQQYVSLKLPADGGDQWTRFVRAINFAIPTLTSESIVDIFSTNEKESLYAFLVVFCGLSINGAVIGSIVGLVSDANEQTTKMHRKIEQLRDYLRSHHTPEALLHSATSFMMYLISDEGNYNLIQDEMFSQLPYALAADIDFELKTIPYLRRCAFFDFCNDDILRSLSSKLRMLSFTKGDKIITCGDMGHEMYFISSGTVNVVSDDGRTVFSTLEEGAFFGETGLFFRSPRVASIVVSSPFCACLQLRKEDLDLVMMSADYDGAAVVKAFKSLQEMNGRRNENIQHNLSLASNVESKLHKIVKPAMEDNSKNTKWIIYLRQVFCPESLFRFYWDSIGLIVLIYYVFSIPLFISFFSQEKLSALTQYVGFEILFNLYWITDILLKLFVFSYRADYINNKLETDGDNIRARYMSTYFWYDIIASIPSELLILIPNIDYLSVLILRTCHLVRCPQLNNYSNLLESHLYRRAGIYIGRSFGMMMKAGIVYLILNHWLSCVFFMIHRFVEKDSIYTYAVQDGLAHYDPIKGQHDVCSTTVLMCYGRTIYFVVGTMTSIGYGDISPYTTREILWQQVVAIAGAYIAAIFMGYCESYQLDKDARSDHAFKTKIRMIERFIQYRQLPTALKESIVMQFNYLWTQTRSLDGIKNTLLENLSEPCRIDVLAHLHRDLIENVPVLRDTCSQLKRRLSAKLTPQIALADSVVYRAGDIGQSIFFVHSGEFLVNLSQDKSTLDAFGLGSLRILLNKEEKYGRLYVRGSHFGEFCLLSKSGLRADTVHAKITSEVYYLLKTDLYEIFLYMTPAIRRDFIYQLFTRVGDVRHMDRSLRPPEEHELLFMFDRQQRIGSLYRLACDICEDLGEMLEDEMDSEEDEAEAGEEEDDDDDEYDNFDHYHHAPQDDGGGKSSQEPVQWEQSLRSSSLGERRRKFLREKAALLACHNDEAEEVETEDVGHQRKARQIRALLRDDAMQAAVKNRETLDRLEQGTPVTYGRTIKRKNTFSAISLMAKQPSDANARAGADGPFDADTSGKGQASPSVVSSRRAAAVATLYLGVEDDFGHRRRSSSGAPRSGKDGGGDDGDDDDDDDGEEDNEITSVSSSDDDTIDEDTDHGSRARSPRNLPGSAGSHKRSSPSPPVGTSAPSSAKGKGKIVSPSPSAPKTTTTTRASSRLASNIKFAMLMRKIATGQSGKLESNLLHNRTDRVYPSHGSTIGIDGGKEQSAGEEEADRERQLIAQHAKSTNAYMAMETAAPRMTKKTTQKPKPKASMIAMTMASPSSISMPSASPTIVVGGRRASQSGRRFSIVQNADSLDKIAAMHQQQAMRSHHASPNGSIVGTTMQHTNTVATNLLDLYEARGVLPAFAKDRLSMLESIANSSTDGNGSSRRASNASTLDHPSPLKIASMSPFRTPHKTIQGHPGARPSSPPKPSHCHSPPSTMPSRGVRKQNAGMLGSTPPMASVPADEEGNVTNDVRPFHAHVEGDDEEEGGSDQDSEAFQSIHNKRRVGPDSRQQAREQIEKDRENDEDLEVNSSSQPNIKKHFSASFAARVQTTTSSKLLVVDKETSSKSRNSIFNTPSPSSKNAYNVQNQSGRLGRTNNVVSSPSKQDHHDLEDVEDDDA
jgi:CRP-like cAMP-binding protein